MFSEAKERYDHKHPTPENTNLPVPGSSSKPVSSKEDPTDEEAPTLPKYEPSPADEWPLPTVAKMMQGIKLETFSDM